LLHVFENNNGAIGRTKGVRTIMAPLVEQKGQ